MQKDDNKRRGFLKSMFTAAAGIGLVSLAGKKAKAESGEKIKLLTPDGKLVEIDKTHIKSESPDRVSNSDVLNWMAPKK
jgi:hypothetical protein